MPASIAAASGFGTFSIRRPSGLKKAVTTTSPAAARKAPTASAIPISTEEAAIRAAPGVDQAVGIGMRWRRLR